MLFRSRHVYLLLTALVNLGIGIDYRPAEGSYRRWVQLGGSVLMLAAPALLLAAFCWEAPRSDIHSPLTTPAILCCFIGTLGHAIGGVRWQRRSHDGEKV
jgi:hypothetical protein